MLWRVMASPEPSWSQQTSVATNSPLRHGGDAADAADALERPRLAEEATRRGPATGNPESPELLRDYDPGAEAFFDEMFSAKGVVRPACRRLLDGIEAVGKAGLLRRQRAAEQAMLKAGVTFTLGVGAGAGERILPFDVIPRVIDAQDWERVEHGLEQRIRALNLFLGDVYGKRQIVSDGVLPAYLVESCPDYRSACRDLSPPKGIWTHIVGTDLIRDEKGSFHVLEDNLRCPSGVSYVIENRRVLKRALPHVFETLPIRPVTSYPTELLECLRYLASDRSDDPNVVVLTPGRFNSAYFEHAFLAQQMGAELVEAGDLTVSADRVYMRTTRGLRQVDVVYRRIGDDYLDPLAFRPESLLGVPGLMDVYRKGNVAIANAPGTGVADDKAIYAYVERMIRYYLAEDAILPNVPTYLCSEPDDRRYVLEHLHELVVKATDGAGGYGMMIGPHTSKATHEEFAQRIAANPRGYIAQPTLCLSRVPTMVGEAARPRHVDLRPFVLYGETIRVQPGGLTRVALREGSLVVNSSQGGGSKDTWVLAE